MSDFSPSFLNSLYHSSLQESDSSSRYSFETKLADYPYPVPMKLEAVPEEGNSYTIVSFTHPGGNVTIPYAVPKGTQLLLYVAEKVTARQIVN